MSTIRIRGDWTLTFAEPGLLLSGIGAVPSKLGKLTVSAADRTRVRGRITIGKSSVDVSGRIKPGSPGIVVLGEDNCEDAIEGGLEAILYIPPFWPTIDYKYDMLIGLLTISRGSRIRGTELKGRPFSVSGVKGWPPEPSSAAKSLHESPSTRRNEASAKAKATKTKAKATTKTKTKTKTKTDRP